MQLLVSHNRQISSWSLRTRHRSVTQAQGIRLELNSVPLSSSPRPSTASLSAMPCSASWTEAKAFHLRPLTGALGAELTGIDLKALVANSRAIYDIKEAFHEYSVLVFRNQACLSAKDLLRIAEFFGEVEARPVVKAQYGLPMVHDLIREKGTLGHYGEVWHQDCSYMHHPPLGTLLYGMEVPAYGNDTVFCDMSLALKTLSPAFVDLLKPLRAVHSAYKMVKKDPSVASLAYDEVEHPVVRRHPDTGELSLFVNPFFTKHLAGMTEEESRPILEHLFEIMTRAELQCRVRWERDTLVVWDNRCVAHQAIRDNTRERRVMRRVEIRGDMPV